MIRPTIAPELVGEDRYGKTVSHPAFGVAVLVRSQGGKEVMFGSELRHSERMTLKIHKANHTRSDLSYDRTIPRELIVEVNFTLSQWAQFVSSQGIGAGTPCTLDSYQLGEMVRAPYIEAPQNHLRKFGDEMKAAITKRTAGVLQAASELEQAIEGNGGKKALREALKKIRLNAESLPGSVDFVNGQFAESMEEITQAAMTEIEGFVVGMAQRTGIEALKQGAPGFPLLTGDRKPE